MSRARRLAYACPLAVALVCALAAPSPSSAAPADIPTATVSAPVPATATSHPHLAADPALLSKYGYIEREYFVTGNAYKYAGATSNTYVDATRTTTGGTNNDGLFPYTTRIVVRRPARAAQFNGTTMLEWNNVTAGTDIDWNWFNDPDYLMRHGYASVSVSAQRAGLIGSVAVAGSVGIKGWSPSRYGTLDISHDDLSYDIFGAVAKAVNGTFAGTDPMGGLDSERIIASGESQSGSRLSIYYNTIHALHDVVDAYLITVSGNRLRADRPDVKAIRVLSEGESAPNPADVDTASYRRWEVAAGSHLPFKAYANFGPIYERDVGPGQADCTYPPLSRVQWPYVANRAIDALVKWDRDGTAPANAPRHTYTGTTLVRDADGNAQGAIRLPAVEVPTATNNAINSSAGTGGFSNFCGLLGSSTPFDQATLDSRYADYGAYMDAVVPKAQAVADAGFVLAEDVPALIADAARFTRLRPVAPTTTGDEQATGRFAVAWRGPDAQVTQTTYELQRRTSAGGAAWETVPGAERWRRTGSRSARRARPRARTRTACAGRRSCRRCTPTPSASSRRAGRRPRRRSRSTARARPRRPARPIARPSSPVTAAGSRGRSP